jgi:uncharacterized protein YxjI
MAETLGMLCDKLTIVKLKEYHTEDEVKLESLKKQSIQLQDEINVYLSDVLSGKIEKEKLTFNSNKVYKPEGNETREISGNIGEIFYQLADINCKLWHEVEKGYNIKDIPSDEKDLLINNLAVMNLERNKCIDAIDIEFLKLVSKK